MDWQTVYDAYPVNEELIWLNNCSTVPAGKHIVEAVSRFVRGYAAKGILTDTEKYESVRDRIKSILSILIGCRPKELALIHNTAEGINFISHGLGLKPGDEIVLLENEYPSNVYPWRHWEEKGVRLITTPMSDTPQQFFDELLQRLGARTRAVTLSAVHWCTGMPIPLERIGTLCRKRNIDFIVDGAQGVGMLPVNVESAHIDFMAFPAWKWLTGPLGLGVLYVNRNKLDGLKPIFTGTESVVRHEEYLPYKRELKPTADRFTISTANFNDWVYFLSALEYLDAIGFATVQKRLLELNKILSTGLEQAGWNVVQRRFPDDPTAIVVAEKEGLTADAAMKHLRRHGIVAARRLGRIRFSPHVYISPEQLERVVEVLSDIPV